MDNNIPCWSHPIDMDATYQQYVTDIAAVEEWCNEAYVETFGQFFSKERELFSRLKSKIHSITDEELEWILTEVPIDLFEVSEAVSQFKLKKEVVKLKCKDKEIALYKTSTEPTDTKRKEAASAGTIYDKLLITAIDTIVARVEGEVSFSRELIMGAKKIWDARRSAENSNPVKEVNPGPDALPEYTPTSTKSAYIK